VKKITVILILSLSIGSVCVLSGNLRKEQIKSDTEQNKTDVQETNNVSVQQIFKAEDLVAKPEIPDEFKGKKIEENNSAYDYPYEATFDNVARDSSNIITAKVNGFSYTATPYSIASDACTVIHVTVTESLIGAIPVDKPLDIYTFGGYIPLRDYLGDSIYDHGISMSDEEIDNTVIYQKSDESALPIIGMEYAFCLNLGKDYDSVPDDAYIRVRGEYGQLLVKEDENKKSFIRRVYGTNETQSYSIEDFDKVR
jgi:hypothetical protein